MAETQADPTLPKFTSPPVVEVVIAVEFAPLPELDTVRLVQMAQRWQEPYPHVTAQPLLPPGTPPPGTFVNGVGIMVGDAAAVRLWLTNSAGHELLQLQNDRVILNWRRQDGGEYPSYDRLRETYAQRWGEFLELLGDVAQLQPLVAEVTFVNVFGEATSGDGDLSPYLRPLSTVTLPASAPILAQSQVQYVGTFKNGLGTLTITAGKMTDAAPQMHVSARVGLGGSEPEIGQILGVLDAAHASCVLGFANITTPEMHVAWGRTA